MKYDSRHLQIHLIYFQLNILIDIEHHQISFQASWLLLGINSIIFSPEIKPINLLSPEDINDEILTDNPGLNELT
jgi:hypothetical protein